MLGAWKGAADQGHAAAQFNLVVMYEQGRAKPQSDKEAAAWYMKVADQGYSDAKINLGIMYEHRRATAAVSPL